MTADLPHISGNANLLIRITSVLQLNCAALPKIR